MPKSYTESQLVEQAAIGLFAELGWHVALPDPHPGPLPAGEGMVADGLGLFGREPTGEVVPVSWLRAPLPRFNVSRLGHQALPPKAIIAAANELTRERLAWQRLSGPEKLKVN